MAVALFRGFTIFPDRLAHRCGIFTILWRRTGSHYFIAAPQQCVRMCVRRARACMNASVPYYVPPIRRRARQIREPRLPAETVRRALYWSTTACIVLAKIGLWLSISITRTDWLRSRAAYSPGVAYMYRRYCSHVDPRGREDSPDPTRKVFLFYDNVLCRSRILYRGRMEAEKRL